MEGLEHRIARDLFAVGNTVARRSYASEKGLSLDSAEVTKITANDAFIFEVTFLVFPLYHCRGHDCNVQWSDQRKRGRGDNDRRITGTLGPATGIAKLAARAPCLYAPLSRLTQDTLSCG